MNGLFKYALVVFATVFSSYAPAQGAYPDKPIKLVVPFAAGATTSAIAQIVSDRLNVELGQPIVLDFKLGAGGTIGADFVAKSKPDGYTLLLSTISVLTFQPAIIKKLPFDPIKDLQPISMLGTTQNVVVVHPSVPVNSIKELIAYSKANPNKLTYGSSGAGSSLHLTGEFFNRQTGASLLHVPYKGGAPARTDLLGGHVSLMFSDLTAAPLIKEGKLRALAVTGAKRASVLPNLPTLAEEGIPNVVVDLWYALHAPAGLPPAVATKLNTAVTKVLGMPEVRRLLAEQGTTAPDDTTPQYLAEVTRSDTAKWGAVIKAANIAAD